MPKELKTEWKIVGRSGPTVDGRIIDPTSLQQAADNYDKKLFTALIWPDHQRWFNMGTVEDLRAEPNDEDGIDLYALIAPNDYYLSYNKSGQYLFTSMELLPDFRDSGEFYLSGLAATDNPASAATSEMRFNAVSNKDAVLGAFTENKPHTFQDDQPPSWFTQFFKNKNPNQNQQDEDDMPNEALAALAARFTAMEAKIDALTPGDNQDEETPSDDYAALLQKVEDLALKFSAMEQDKGTDTPEDSKEFKQLQADYKKLRQDFDTAVNKDDGTPTPEHDGDSVDNDNLY